MRKEASGANLGAEAGPPCPVLGIEVGVEPLTRSSSRPWHEEQSSTCAQTSFSDRASRAPARNCSRVIRAGQSAMNSLLKDEGLRSATN
jgi:hypothetical protein